MVKMKQSSSMMGMGEMNTTSTIISTMKVVSVTDSGYDLTMKVKRLLMELDMMGNNKTMDTDKESSTDDGDGGDLKKILKEEKSYSLNAYTGTLEEKKTDKAPIDIDMSEADDAVTGSMLEMQSANQKAIFMILPEKPTVGVTWSDSTISEVSVIRNNYIITGIKDNLITVAITGTTVGEGDMEMMGMTMTTKTDNKNTGVAIINRKTGITQSLKMIIVGTSDVDMMGQKMNIDSNITTETTVE